MAGKDDCKHGRVVLVNGGPPDGNANFHDGKFVKILDLLNLKVLCTQMAVLPSTNNVSRCNEKSHSEH